MPNVRTVNFNYELTRGLRKHEHRGGREQALEGRECALGLRGPGEGTEGGGEGSKWGRDPAEAKDETSVEVRESKETSGAVCWSAGRAHSSTALTFLGSARTCPFSTMWPRNSTEGASITHFLALTKSLFSSNRWRTRRTWAVCSLGVRENTRMSSK